MARKLFGFDPETLQALELLSKDSGRRLQQLGDEARCQQEARPPSSRASVSSLGG
jgi:hypothetical protein